MSFYSIDFVLKEIDLQLCLTEKNKTPHGNEVKNMNII